MERRRQRLGKHTRRARGDREVPEKAGMVPVGEAGDEDAFEVGEDGAEGFGILRRLLWKRCGDVARLYAGEYRISIRVFEVIGDPVDQLVTMPAEVIGLHGTVM